MLLKTHINKIFNLISELGLDINKFEGSQLLTMHPTEELPWRLTIKETLKPYFDIACPETYHTFQISYSQFAPNHQVTNIPVDGGIQLNEDQLFVELKKWLKFNAKVAIEDLEQPDLFESLKQSPLTVGDINFDDTSPFTEPEIESLKIGLDEIKGLLEDRFQLTEVELKLVHSQIEYLKEATTRLNKTDWKGITISAIIGIASNLAFDNEKRQILWNLFSKIWSLAQQLPPAF